MNRRRNLLILICGAILLASLNLPYGRSSDFDTSMMLESARNFAERGYHPGRGWGFPAYELMLYPIVAYQGVFWAKIYSLICYVLACVVFFLTLEQITTNSRTAFWGAVCFLVVPISIISGNTILEMSQAICLGLAGLYFFVRYVRGHGTRDLFLMAAALGLATSTRIDYVVLSGTIALTLLFFRHVRWGSAFVATLVWSAALALPFLTYGQLDFGTTVVLPDPLKRKIARAALGYLAVLGLPATAFLGWTVLSHHKRWLTTLQQLRRDEFLFVAIAWIILFLPRFAILPDELEYLFLLVPMLVVAGVRLGARPASLALFALALSIPNAAHVHFFSREDPLRTVVRVGISHGSILQDRSSRLRREYLEDELPATFEEIARSRGYDSYATLPSPEEGALVIIQDERLRIYRGDRFGGEMNRAMPTQTVIAFPMPANLGWRQFIAHKPWRLVTREDFREVTVADLE